MVRGWQVFNVSRSSYFRVIVGSCYPGITVSGTVEYMNPYGYLPAELFGYLWVRIHPNRA